MDATTIDQLARAIAKAQVADHWLFYVLWLCLAFLAGAAGSYVSAYMKARGTELATKADFDNLLERTTTTSSAVERIKSDIASLDWSKRELKAILRVKLEALLQLASEIDDLTQSLWSSVIEGGELIQIPQISKFEATYQLYFPEITDDCNAFRKKALGLRVKALNVMGAAVALPPHQRVSYINEHSAGFMGDYQALRAAHGTLMVAARRLFAQTFE